MPDIRNAIAARYAAGDKARRDARAEVLRSFKTDPKLESDCRYFDELTAYDKQRVSPQLRRDVQAYRNLKRAAEVFAATGEVPPQFVITFDPNHSGDAA